MSKNASNKLAGERTHDRIIWLVNWGEGEVARFEDREAALACYDAHEDAYGVGTRYECLATGYFSWKAKTLEEGREAKRGYLATH